MMINDWTSRYPSFRQIQMSQSASFSSFCSFLFSSSQQNTSFCDRTRRTAIYPRLNELRISISSLRNHHQQSPAFSFLPFLSFFSLALPVAWSCELNSHGQVLLAENKWRTLPPIVSFLKKKNRNRSQQDGNRCTQTKALNVSQTFLLFVLLVCLLFYLFLLRLLLMARLASYKY